CSCRSRTGPRRPRPRALAPSGRCRAGSRPCAIRMRGSWSDCGLRSCKIIVSNGNGLLNGDMIRFLYLFLLAALAADCGGSARRPEPATERPQTGPERAPEVVDSRPVIVALGDSLTAGLGVAPDQSYPAKLQKKGDAGGHRY